MRFPLVLMPAVLLLTVLAVIVAEWLVQPAGVSSEECLSCHRLDEIGKVTTEGVPILNDYQWQTELHLDLDKPDCVACHTVHGNGSPLFEHDLLRASVGSDCTFCHSDTAPDDTLHSTIDIACGVCHSTETWSDASFDHALLTASAREDCIWCHSDAVSDDTLHDIVGDACGVCHSTETWSDARFDHALLSASARNDCVSCHSDAVPDDTLHDIVGDACGTCHSTETWSDARFDHDVLSISVRNDCASCHLQQAPSDSIHRSAGNNCGACHSTASWSDAVLDHDRFFRFDRRHPATCTDCHLVPGDYSSYSCYGSCHAHNETEMRNKHLEEGIRNYQDCARCHRGGNERD